MTTKIIVNEFLNNFYTYEQLADVLDVDVILIKNILLNNEIIENELGKTFVKKVERHKELIEAWNKNKNNPSLYIESQIDEDIVKMANYIVVNNSSIKKASEIFHIGKSTAHDRINNRLPIISIVLYKKVFDVLKANKSYSIIESKIKRDEIYRELELLKKGYTIEQISNILGTSRNKVQRDLSKRLSILSPELGFEAHIELKTHQNRMFESQKNKQKK